MTWRHWRHAAPAHRHQRVVVVLLLVEPVTPDVLPVALLLSVLPVEPVAPLVAPVPEAPMALVPPVALLPVVVSVLLPLAVLGLVPVLGMVAALSVDGVVVVLLDDVDEPAVPAASCFVQAPSDSAATAARAAAAEWVRDIFMGKLLEASV